MGAIPPIQRLIISAPFGNYIQPAGCTPTLGTFTAARRPGRVWRVLATVRYYRRLKGWVNQIGLRNPGMPWLVERVGAGRVNVADKIVSIHGFSEGDWFALLDQVAGIRPLAVELNMSCPNIGEINWPAGLFPHAAGGDVPVIVKLPPVHYRVMAEGALAAGIRAFHCCNTLPVPAGGLSGKPLKPFSIQCIRDLREQIAAGLDLLIIGGGGITQPADIDDYTAAGATHFALGTKVFNPKYLFTHRPLAPLLERCARHRAPAGSLPD
jgi:dihydroorotate dehydrogenase